MASTAGLNCSFESENCSWTQDKKDNFDWVRHKGKTPSTGTGPSYDNTFTNASGKRWTFTPLLPRLCTKCLSYPGSYISIILYVCTYMTKFKSKFIDFSESEG